MSIQSIHCIQSIQVNLAHLWVDFRAFFRCFSTWRSIIACISASILCSILHLHILRVPFNQRTISEIFSFIWKLSKSVRGKGGICNVAPLTFNHSQRCTLSPTLDIHHIYLKSNNSMPQRKECTLEANFLQAFWQLKLHRFLFLQCFGLWAHSEST